MLTQRVVMGSGTGRVRTGEISRDPERRFGKRHQGGMGEVHAAEDPKLNRQVALSFITMQLVEGETLSERIPNWVARSLPWPRYNDSGAKSFPRDPVVDAGCHAIA